MALPVFTRAAARVLAHFGQDALLRGDACRVHLEHGVDVQGDEGRVTFEKLVATMLREMAPRQGDALVIGLDSYTVDSPPFADSGYTVRVVLR